MKIIKVKCEKCGNIFKHFENQVNIICPKCKKEYEIKK